ncbi:hypothetical protein [Pseudomonas donghuensis]|uniref:hypothetical protein n=1 Tax=Pseudomonas donghuensis TaxID=1163398 RepID=UPI002E111F7A|nr:hypothetical protein VP780_10615 [Pseudomonas donghuensis]
MYLMIFEDGEIKNAEDVSDADLQAADDGVLDIVDISEPFTPKRRFNGDWVEVESIDD